MRIRTAMSRGGCVYYFSAFFSILPFAPRFSSKITVHLRRNDVGEMTRSIFSSIANLKTTLPTSETLCAEIMGRTWNRRNKNCIFSNGEWFLGCVEKSTCKMGDENWIHTVALAYEWKLSPMRWIAESSWDNSERPCVRMCHRSAPSSFGWVRRAPWLRHHLPVCSKFGCCWFSMPIKLR